jgi:hypothetical protein
MTLPASGQIGISTINTEYWRSSVSDMDASLTNLSTDIGLTAPHNISEFYSKNVCAVEYGGEYIITNYSTEQDRYASILRSSHDSPNTMSVTLTIYLYTISSSSAYVYYRINNGSWITIASRTTAGTTNTSFTISNFVYNATVDVRTRVIWNGAYNTTSRATINNVSWYTGSGYLAKGDNLIQETNL